LAELLCPPKVDDKIWIIHKEPVEDGVEGWVLGPNAVHMEIGTITAVGELEISILLCSGLVVNVTHEKMKEEVNQHNGIVQEVADAKKTAADANKLQGQTEVKTFPLAPLIAATNALMNPPPPPPLVEFVLPQAMTDVTVAIAAQIMQAAKKMLASKKKRMREAEEEDGDNILAMKKKLKLALDEKKAAKASREKETVRAKLAIASMDVFCDLDNGLVKRAKPKLTRLDHWQLGNKAARERKSGYVSAAICDTLGEVHIRLQTHSWAVMNNMAMLFPESC
jgi:hypothetical protein